MKLIFTFTKVVGLSMVLNLGLQKSDGGPTVSRPTYQPHLSFDIAAIHETRDDGVSYIDNVPGSSAIRVHNLSAWGIVYVAYGLRIMDLLVNEPAWAKTTRYEIQARSDAATDAALAQLGTAEFLAEKEHMLQRMLAERFQLRIHPEERMANTYMLTATTRVKDRLIFVPGDASKTISTCSAMFSAKGEEIDAKGCPFALLLSQLRDATGTEITDGTGLTGTYAYHLKFRPAALPERSEEEQYPDLIDALHEQLGLELKRTKGPVTFLVIDHMERPTAN